MALHTFGPDEIEDGTGKPTALVFEQPDDTATWLVQRGFPSFAAGDDATSQAAAINATRRVLTAMVPFWRGRKRVVEQAFLLPSQGAYRKDRTLLRVDEIPEDFLEGVRIATEKEHAGTLYVGVTNPDLKREEVEGVDLEYFSAASRRAVIDDADVWPLVSRVCPPL